MRSRVALVSSVLLLIGPACHADPETASPIPTNSTQDTGRESGAKLSEFSCGEEFPPHARCGDFEVWEDRAAATGRTLDLRWVVLPATAPSEALPDPVFVFAGGPGQAATELTVLANTQLAEVNSTRDIVFIDQRGTGQSNPLQCMASSLEDMLEGVTAPGQRELLEGCKARWDADLSLYDTTTAMADINELREALGYEQINIWGVSYGSRAALEYARRHEPSVRSVLAWGIAPPEQPYLRAFVPATKIAVDALLADCAAVEGCAELLPDGKAKLDEILARLTQNPVELELVDPRSGELATLEVDGELFMTGVRLVLYDASWSASLPAMLAAAYAEDYQPLMDFVVTFTVAVYSHIYVGMHLAVTCGEDAPRLSEADVEAASASMSGARTLREIIDTCAAWPKPTLPADWTDPVTTQVPVLLMNGTVDPATPLSAAQLAGRSLPNAKVIPFANVSHGTSNVGPCVNQLIRSFLDNPDPNTLDASCAGEGQRPPFVIR